LFRKRQVQGPPLAVADEQMQGRPVHQQIDVTHVGVARGRLVGVLGLSDEEPGEQFSAEVVMRVE